MTAPPVRWGLVGASTIASIRVIPAIRAAGGLIASVYSRNGRHAAEYAAGRGIPHATDSLDHLLDIVDAVYISSINTLHHPQTLAAAKAGRHVLCEKPIAVTVAQADEMIAACRKAGVVLAVNHHLRGSVLHREIRDIVRAGRLGRILSIRVMNAGYLPDELRTWRLDRSQGGGIALDKTVHDIDLLRFILDDEPIEVKAMTQETDLGAGTYDHTIVASLRFAKGTLAQLHDSFEVPFFVTELHVHGTAGTLVARDCLTGTPRGTLTIHDAAGDSDIPLAHDDLYRPGIEAFHLAIAGNGRPIASGEDGRAALAASLLVI